MRYKKQQKQHPLSHFLTFTSMVTNGQRSTRLYDKRDDFHFPIINFPHLDSNIPTVPAYEVCVSKLLHYAPAYSLYSDFLQRHSILSTKLINREFLKNPHFIFQKGFRKIYIVEKNYISCVTTTKDSIGN